MKLKISALHRKRLSLRIFLPPHFRAGFEDVICSNDTLCVTYDHIGLLDDLPCMRMARLSLANYGEVDDQKSDVVLFCFFLSNFPTNVATYPAKFHNEDPSRFK